MNTNLNSTVTGCLEEPIGSKNQKRQANLPYSPPNRTTTNTNTNSTTSNTNTNFNLNASSQQGSTTNYSPAQTPLPTPPSQNSFHSAPIASLDFLKA
ncbi:unnamed protein product [Ambrosiozyma monospora]|uniref:Unnamed protein product n=1 Tax=Ambrosiozyma monospora TaxID=43982 RepID=A0ACB5ST96_AMBMO|nr:unnamed protein product [Ambrosiozyma monospora]